MARTEISVHDITLAQLALTANEETGQADGYKFLNTGDMMLFIRNTNAAARDITLIGSGVTTGGADFADETISVAGLGSAMWGGFETAPFNVKAEHMVYVDFDSGNETDLKIVACRFFRAT